MKLLLLGHSYVNHLSRLQITRITINNIYFDIKYLGIPGGTFVSLLNAKTIINNAVAFKPDITVVILGGNDLTNDSDNIAIYDSCREFYSFLRITLPCTIIVAAQIEKRFYLENNRFNAPNEVLYDYRRKYFNKFLKRLKTKDCILQVQGKNCLDNKLYYSDQVHLNQLGLRTYFSFIKSTVEYSIQRFNL